MPLKKNNIMKKLLTTLSVLFITIFSFGQNTKVLQGDYSFLRSAKEVNVEFKYDNLQLMKENLTEEEYVENRQNDLNKKNRGTGDQWMKQWEGAKSTFWEPKFMELINVVLSKKKKDLYFMQDNTELKHTLIVDVVWIYSGWDAAVMKQAAKVSTNLKFVETDNRDNVLLEIESIHAPGNQFGSNFNNETRIAKGFAKTAKTLSTNIVKKAF